MWPAPRSDTEGAPESGVPRSGRESGSRHRGFLPSSESAPPRKVALSTCRGDAQCIRCPPTDRPTPIMTPYPELRPRPGSLRAAHADVAMIMTNPNTCDCVSRERCILLSHNLEDRLRRLERVLLLSYVDTDTIGATLLDGGEDGRLAILIGEVQGGVSAPYLVRLSCYSAAPVRIRRSSRQLLVG